jgi:hypothetical protein
MPGPKRSRRERTEEWASIKQWMLWPEQEWYEAIRPLVLFHETAGEQCRLCHCIWYPSLISSSGMREAYQHPIQMARETSN